MHDEPDMAMRKQTKVTVLAFLAGASLAAALGNPMTGSALMSSLLCLGVIFD